MGLRYVFKWRRYIHKLIHFAVLLTQIVEPINKIINTVEFDAVFYSLDWHPSDHVSFIDNIKKRPLHPTSPVILDCGCCNCKFILTVLLQLFSVGRGHGQGLWHGYIFWIAANETSNVASTLCTRFLGRWAAQRLEGIIGFVLSGVALLYVRCYSNSSSRWLHASCYCRALISIQWIIVEVVH